MRADTQGKLHEHYSSSASILQIVKRYGITQAQLSEKLKVSKNLVSLWVKAKQPIGIKMYNKIIAEYPEMEGRIDHSGTYKNNYTIGEDNV